MAVTVASFQAAFPAFKTVKASQIEATLARAARWVSADVWGDKTDDGVSLLAASWLIEDPTGTSTASTNKPGTNVYGKQWADMRDAIVGGFAGGGTWGGCL